MFEMTYNEAIEIQEKQIAHYYRDGQGPLTTGGIAELKRRTLPCPFDPNELRPVREINELVPRGGDIESIMGCDFSRASSGPSLSCGVHYDHDRVLRRQIRLDRAAKANNRITKRNGAPMFY
jgi:hypothetical protein